MFFLYADESGIPGSPNEEHFVLAGISVFEQRAFYLESKLDRIAARFSSNNPNEVELHGSPMMVGKNRWRRIGKRERVDAIKDALKVIDGKKVRIFGCVVRKQALPADEGPLDYAFEHMIIRFDDFLARLHSEYDNTQRGLVIFDKSKAENEIQSSTRLFSRDGHRSGRLKNMAEVPMFIDSKATRLVQLADLVAYAIFRNFEHGDDQFYRIIQDKFDVHDGQRKGMHECL